MAGTIGIRTEQNAMLAKIEEARRKDLYRLMQALREAEGTKPCHMALQLADRILWYWAELKIYPLGAALRTESVRFPKGRVRDRGSERDHVEGRATVKRQLFQVAENEVEDLLETGSVMVWMLAADHKRVAATRKEGGLTSWNAYKRAGLTTLYIAPGCELPDAVRSAAKLAGVKFLEEVPRG